MANDIPCTMPSQPVPTKPDRTPRLPRRRRRGRLVLLLITAVVLLLPVVLTRTPFLKVILLPLLESKLGAEIEVERLVIEPDARVVATGVDVVLPGIVSRAGEVLTAERIEIKSSWGKLLTGSGSFDEMVLIKPVLRLSRDMQSGAINLGALRTPSSADGPMTRLPRVLVREGTIELGEHTGERYALLRTLSVEGSAQPIVDTEGEGFVLAFTEGAVSDGQGRGLGLTGRVSAEGVSLQLDGLELGQWRPEHIPAQFREVFDIMQIEGGIPRASMRVSVDGQASGVVELEGVSLTLPFDSAGHQADRADLVRLRDVRGRVELTDAGVEAFFEGKLGDLPSKVWLRYDGLTADAGFRCEVETEGFVLESEPELQPLVPPMVLERLNDFSNPTMTVDASVVLERAPPGSEGVGAISVSGELEFSHGSASFHNFPYLFGELTGLARFDESGIDLVRVDGVAQSGARMHASGVIAPLISAAAVDLRITVDDVPIDDDLLHALGPKRRPIIEALMSREKYRQLCERGLVRLPGENGPGVPFVLGGVGSVVIDVQRALGEVSHYTEQVRVRIPEAGLVHEWFPLPIIARDVELLVADDEVCILAGTFESANGGRVGVDLFVDLTQPGESGLHLTITANEVPTDALLLAALPGGLEASVDEQPASPVAIRSSSAVLEQLGVEGAIDCEVRIEARENGELGYDIDVGFDGLTARPRHEPDDETGAVVLRDVAGQLRVNERELGLVVTSRVGAAGERLSRSGRLSIEAALGLGEGRQPFTAEVEAEVPQVGLALEDLLSVVAPQLAGKIADIRREYQPEGGVRLVAHAAGETSAEGGLSKLDIEVLGCEGLIFDTQQGRLRVTSETGTLSFSALSPKAVEFDGWVAQVRLDEGRGYGVELSGRSPFGRAWTAGDVLVLGLRGTQLETPLVWGAAARSLPATLAQAMQDSEVACVFDADLELRGEGGSSMPLVTGEIRPSRFELTIAGQRVTMDSVRGGIVLDETGGAFEAFRAEGAGWWGEIRGTWVDTGGGSVLLEGILDAASENGLVPEVRALLPTGLRHALDAVSIEAAGGVTAEGVEFRVALDDGTGEDEQGGGLAYTASGRVTFSGVSADFGVKVTDATGYLDFSGQNELGGAIGNFGIGVVIDSARAAGIQLREGMLRVTSDPMSGSVLVPVILADAYGGRVSGSALVQDGPDGRPFYEAEFRISGVPLGELLADWEYLAQHEGAAGDEGDAGLDGAAGGRRDAESRGYVDAGLRLRGVVGEPSTRRGRGQILIGGDDRAEVLRLPLLLPLIKVSNLQVPVNDPLDFGEAVFYLDGDRVVFERVGVFARSVEIFGYGQMTLPGLDLDFRFSSRAAERVPVLSTLLEKFRDELVTTRVRGTMHKPEISLEQFAVTKRLLEGVLGGEPSEQDRRMREIERLSRESERREWRIPRRGGSASTRGR